MACSKRWWFGAGILRLATDIKVDRPHASASKTCQVCVVWWEHDGHDDHFKFTSRSWLGVNLLMFQNEGIGIVKFGVNSFRRAIGSWLPVFLIGGNVKLFCQGILECSLDNLKGFMVHQPLDVENWCISFWWMWNIVAGHWDWDRHFGLPILDRGCRYWSVFVIIEPSGFPRYIKAIEILGVKIRSQKDFVNEVVECAKWFCQGWIIEPLH